MNNKYYVTFTGWIPVHASTPQEAAEIVKRILDNTGGTGMIEDVEQEDY